ncbi:MAG TPA: cytochrome ubiquinol oxidase subunit I [Polyangia bacterium]|nr:cytochrome ubiquinol oxidase subunit I [Polyangia bacterium]
MGTSVADALLWHRLQFAFTAVYHYLFPQLTIGLALLIVVLKALHLRRGDEGSAAAARFWIRVFGINFVVGVVTGIPMEFQFGTNWARFTQHAGGVIGQTLALEGMFAFFLESTFLGLLVWGEGKISPRAHFLAALALFAGSWLSGYFIVATNAFLQHPVGYTVDSAGGLALGSFWALLLNPWALLQYAHTLVAAVVTGSFVMCAVGAYWLLSGVHQPAARASVSVGAVAGLAATLLVAFPTGDQQAKMVARYQPAALAAMEGRFESGSNAEITLIGQPNVHERQLDNPIRVPGFLSFLAFGHFSAEVLGLNEFPPRDWPTNIELLYYVFHVMVGLGTIMMALMALAALQAWRGRLHHTRPLLWILMLTFPLPYIANGAGWLSTELGRQPWLIYGLLRTADGSSVSVHAGDALFTLIGFAGMYLVIGVTFLFLVAREVSHGPPPAPAPAPAAPAPAPAPGPGPGVIEAHR